MCLAVVRDPSDPSKTQFLKDEAAKLDKSEDLTFCAGDLMEPGSYDQAFEDVWGVLHTAAITPSKGEGPESIVQPAIDGTENVIDSVKANKKSIQRFVNVASAVTIISADKASDTVFTDDDWNTWSTVERGDAFGYAKTLAEKMIFEDQELKDSVGVVASINPTIVIGPCFTKAQTEVGSANIMTRCLEGKNAPNMILGYVDVRDVAKGASLCFTNEPKTMDEQRFLLCATKSMSFSELSTIVKSRYPQAKGFSGAPMVASYLFVGLNLPFLRKLIGFTEYMAYFGMTDFQLDTTKSKTVLGLGEYRSFEQTCKDSAESIGKWVFDDEDTTK